jgi:hypothetical protein
MDTMFRTRSVYECKNMNRISSEQSFQIDLPKIGFLSTYL